MHDDEVPVGRGQVAALVGEQLPALAGLDVVRLPGAGTVNAIYRVGEEVTARFPLRRDDPSELERRLRQEALAAAEFRAVCGVEAPDPLHVGRPGHGYPLPWSAQTWVPGEVATPTSHREAEALVDDLVEVVNRLRAVDPGERTFEGGGRGGALDSHDRWIETCIGRSEGLADTGAMRSAWARFRSLPREDPDRMCHGDLNPFNLVVDGDRLAGILDSGGFGPADPALELVAGWHLFDDERRERFRRELDCSDLQWQRGMAWAFQQGAGASWYYRDTNLAMAELGRLTLERVLGAVA